MLHIFNFPDIGEGLEEGTIEEWMVKKGQTVSVGDILVTMETDKVVAEIPSPKNGIIKSLFGKVGDIVKVGEPLVEIEMEGGSDAAKVESPDKEVVKEEGAGVVGTLEIANSNFVMGASEEGLDSSEEKDTKDVKVKATPVARALAKEMRVDINQVKGSGPAGRVQKKDIQEYYNNRHKASLSKKSSPQEGKIVVENEVEIEELSQIRKTIAKNMLKSKHNAAHMSCFDKVVVDELVRVRSKFKNAKEGVKLSFLPFIIKATAVALKKHKALNSEIDLENNKIIYKKYYNIGIAVDTDRGLVVPVIKNADRLSIWEIAEQLNLFIEKAENNQLALDDMKDGTFTITNFGSVGGIYASPVINYPQVGILGLGKISKEPLVQNDEIVVSNQIPLSISVDHCAVDGAEVTRFMNTVGQYLNEPASLLLD